MTRFTLLCLSVVLAGCCGTRSVTVQPPTPPPSVVVRTDTVRLASLPDTAYVERVRTTVVEREGRVDTVRQTVYRTVPQRVVEYRDARPDTTTAFRMHALVIDSSHVRLLGTQRDHAFRRPEKGETLVVTPLGRDSLSAVVVGEPSRPPPITVEAPACPTCVVGSGWAGRVRLVLWLVGALVLGAMLGAALVWFVVPRWL